LFLYPAPHIGSGLWFALVVSGTLNALGAVLYIKAIKISDISLVIPLISLTPLFLFITSPLIIGEWPSAVGSLGVVLIVAGSYVLNFKHRSDGYLAPLKAVYKEKGPRLMLLVALIWSISSNFDKIGVLNSSPMYWSAAIYLYLFAALAPLILWRSGDAITKSLKSWKVFLLIGLFAALTAVFQMSAMKLALVAYVISVKRLSIILCVLAGTLLFKENNLKERLLGSFLMLLGVILIALSG
jgi:uncharacterized membrane protein